MSGVIDNQPTVEIPTVTDNAISQGLLAAPEVGFFFAPAASSASQNGELSFGGVDSEKIVGPLLTV